jgi:hypothetical protein
MGGFAPQFHGKKKLNPTLAGTSQLKNLTEICQRHRVAQPNGMPWA